MTSHEPIPPVTRPAGTPKGEKKEAAESARGDITCCLHYPWSKMYVCVFVDVLLLLLNR